VRRQSKGIGRSPGTRPVLRCSRYDFRAVPIAPEPGRRELADNWIVVEI